jgi:hypothetical protein
MKTTALCILACILSVVAQAQKTPEQKNDTIIVELAKTSRVIFTIRDRSDIQQLKHYNFNQLFHDVLTKLEANDTSALVRNDTAKSGDSEEVYWTRKGDSRYDENGNPREGGATYSDGGSYSDGEHEHVDIHIDVHGRRWGKTWQSTNFDVGINNYMSNGSFSDASNEKYAVRPWGSWYVGVWSTQRSRVGRNFFLEWALGLSWYNFKFQDDDVLITETDQGVTFTAADIPDANYKKSKLSASYVIASFIPMIDLDDNDQRTRVWEGGSAFRIGIGPYIGYRIGSHSKLVYSVDGDREKDKERNNFYLNNLRYGARLQIGFHSTDLFFNYDINKLFSDGKGPDLNAFSFGVIF